MATRNRFSMILLEVLVALALGFAVVVTFRAIMARAEPADQWIEIVIEADRCVPCLDREDRQFIRYMANRLTADPSVEPTPSQRQWLTAIKERLERRRK